MGFGPNGQCLALPILVDRWSATDDLATSIPLVSPLSSWRRPVSSPSIPGCCLPISFSVCLVFSLLGLCLAWLSWQALMILLCARTISVYVVWLWSWGPIVIGQQQITRIKLLLNYLFYIIAVKDITKFQRVQICLTMLVARSPRFTFCSSSQY